MAAKPICATAAEILESLRLALDPFSIRNECEVSGTAIYARLTRNEPMRPFPGAADAGGRSYTRRDGASALFLREDEPLLMNGRDVQIMPLREAAAEVWQLLGGDADPRGLPVVGRDGKIAGHVSDLWVDRLIKLLRYREVELGEGGQRLVPIFFADVSPKLRRVKTRSIFAAQFVLVPQLATPDRIMAREEDCISAYFAGGKRFAKAVRAGVYTGGASE